MRGPVGIGSTCHLADAGTAQRGVGEGTQVRDGVTQLGVRVALLQASCTAALLLAQRLPRRPRSHTGDRNQDALGG
jgi:hypothetical protein